MRTAIIALVGSLATLTLITGCTCSKCEKPPQTEAPPAISAERLAMGREAFQTGMCFKCHGQDGTGTKRAPDLTDGEWLHCDGSVEGILGVLDRGVPKSELKDPNRPFAMNPATNLIPDADTRLALAQYVWSLSHPETD